MKGSSITGSAGKHLSGSMAVVAALLISVQIATAGPQDQSQQSGANTFSTSCASWHGRSGDGNTAIAKALHVPDLRSGPVQGQADAQLRQIILDGEGNMPSFKSSLSAAQVDSVLSYIRLLSNQQK